MAETTAYDFTLTGIDGKPMPLSQFKGHARAGGQHGVRMRLHPAI